MFFWIEDSQKDFVIVAKANSPREAAQVAMDHASESGARVYSPIRVHVMKEPEGEVGTVLPMQRYDEFKFTRKYELP